MSEAMTEEAEPPDHHISRKKRHNKRSHTKPHENSSKYGSKSPTSSPSIQQRHRSQDKSPSNSKSNRDGPRGEGHTSPHRRRRNNRKKKGKSKESGRDSPARLTSSQTFGPASPSTSSTEESDSNGTQNRRRIGRAKSTDEMDEFLVHEGEVLDEFLKTKGESVVDDATFLMKQFRTLFKDVSRNLQKPNVLLTGITGAGKSSLINTIFGKNVAETGTGIPITQHFTKYDDEDMRIVIYDSKGLEHGEFEDFIETTTDFFEEHSIGVHGESENAIHVVWYILNSASSRFEPFEQRICRELFNRAPIMFLLNKADISTQEDRDNLKQLINDMELPNCVGIFDVMASPVAKYKNFTVCPNNKCNSDDLAIRKRTGIMECLECGHQEPLFLDDGLSTTIKATITVLPAVVRDAFISAQTVSFHVKEESSRAILEEFWNEFPTVRTRAKLLKIVAKMMARLSIVWEFKNNGHLYGSMMAKNLVSALKWKDKMNLLFGKKLQAQRLHTTSLGILWNRCLRELATSLFEKWRQTLEAKKLDISESVDNDNEGKAAKIQEKITLEEERVIRTCSDLFHSCFSQLNEDNLVSIEEEISNSDVFTVLDGEVERGKSL